MKRCRNLEVLQLMQTNINNFITISAGVYKTLYEYSTEYTEPGGPTFYGGIDEVRS